MTVPPLREREGDVALLARHFTRQAAQRNALPCPEVSAAALASLEGRRWKGNVRELENAVERAVLLASGNRLEPAHVQPEDVGLHVAIARPASVEPAEPKMVSLWEMERELILKTLAAKQGNRTHAAKALGISLRTMRNKLREYRELERGRPLAEVGAEPAAAS